MSAILQNYVSRKNRSRFIQIGANQFYLLGLKFFYVDWDLSADYSGYHYRYLVYNDFIHVFEPEYQRLKKRIQVCLPTECLLNFNEKELALDLRINGFQIKPIPVRLKDVEHYLVAFTEPDITFYDGEAVYVRRFMLVGKRFIERENYCFFDYYPELIKIAERTDRIIQEVAANGSSR